VSEKVGRKLCWIVLMRSLDWMSMTCLEVLNTCRMSQGVQANLSNLYGSLLVLQRCFSIKCRARIGGNIKIISEIWIDLYIGSVNLPSSSFTPPPVRSLRTHCTGADLDGVGGQALPRTHPTLPEYMTYDRVKGRGIQVKRIVTPSHEIGFKKSKK
jgi:hypothetical protein